MYVVERRSPRFPFIASAQVVETRTEARLQARTSDLSREGCYLDMLNPLPTGTRLRINVTHHNQQLDAVDDHGRRAFSLGRWGLWVNIAAVAYGAAMMVKNGQVTVNADKQLMIAGFQVPLPAAVQSSRSSVSIRRASRSASPRSHSACGSSPARIP